ncbi:hypothetical protein PRIPAC_92517 [Pristionchus pacificus]|uniref:Uncharacterized protein n=1 Tax=Pristionchus pacificus TaxID=54126 RepID=A0A2A6CDS7_PRIPA|nr:hypothetical protein PRIPAC_92517 [Pristionchus pacificus]|eukprot:PDM76372.1 hypothetical protein PRIPAC_39976 [Pristionchus pacificus]
MPTHITILRERFLAGLAGANPVTVSSEKEVSFLARVGLNSLDEVETLLRDALVELDQFRQLTESVKEIEGDDRELITFYDEATFEEFAKLDPVKSSFFLSRFAQAAYEPKCHDEDKPIIVPVYYHAGGTVELPCKQCEWAHVTWKHIPLHHATVFLADPSKFLLQHGSDEKYVQSLKTSLTPVGGGFHRRAHLLKKMYRDDADKWISGTHNPVPPPQRHASIHHYIQADGRLYIHGSMLESSGIYFCYDTQSRDAHTRIFFVLMAMAPLVHHTGATGKMDVASVWNVDDWLTSGQDYEETCSEFDESKIEPMPDEFAHMRYSPATYPANAEAVFGKVPRNLSFFIGTATDDTFLEVDHEYSEWTTCRAEELFQYREAHCVLKRKPGERIKEFKDVPWLSWISQLNAYFDRISSIRLHSYVVTSLIYKGHSYGPHNADTEACDLRKPKIWNAFMRAILPALTGETYEKLKEMMDVSKWDNDRALPMTLDGMKKPCFEIVAKASEKWWAIRGISFIEKKACTMP